MTAKSDSTPYGVIYCVTNKVSGKKYIGQTTGTVAHRWSKHCGGGRQCRVLRSAIDKYGKDSFVVAQIDRADSKEELDAKEIWHIAKNRADDRLHGYNIAPGGAVGKHAKETCELISKALKGKPLSAEHCIKLSVAQMGHKRSVESRAKQSASATGAKRPKSAAHIEKIAAAHRGKKHGPMSAEHRAKIGAANKGKKHGPISQETRLKIGAAHRGVPKVVSPEAKLRMSEMFRNREFSPESRQKMSESHMGKTQSQETIEKRVAAHRGRKNTSETKALMSAIRIGKPLSAKHVSGIKAAWSDPLKKAARVAKIKATWAAKKAARI